MKGEEESSLFLISFVVFVIYCIDMVYRYGDEGIKKAALTLVGAANMKIRMYPYCLQGPERKALGEGLGAVLLSGHEMRHTQLVTTRTVWCCQL